MTTAQPYGLLRHLPSDSMSLVVKADGEERRIAVLGYRKEVPYGLEEGEVALYSSHGQVLYFKDDGSIHLEARKAS